MKLSTLVRLSHRKVIDDSDLFIASPSLIIINIARLLIELVNCSFNSGVFPERPKDSEDGSNIRKRVRYKNRLEA